VEASEFPALFRELEIPGASVKPAEGKSGSGVEHGFIVTGRHGARIAWQVAIQKDGQLAGDGPPAAYPEAVPAEPDLLVCADVEASIAAWIGQSAAGPHVRTMRRYSETKETGLRYGLALDLYSGGRVFIQALWILEPGETPDKDNKYRMRDSV
jgi:hypothetical protein